MRAIAELTAFMAITGIQIAYQVCPPPSRCAHCGGHTATIIEWPRSCVTWEQRQNHVALGSLLSWDGHVYVSVCVGCVGGGWGGVCGGGGGSCKTPQNITATTFTSPASSCKHRPNTHPLPSALLFLSRFARPMLTAGCCPRPDLTRPACTRVRTEHAGELGASDLGPGGGQPGLRAARAGARTGPADPARRGAADAARGLRRAGRPDLGDTGAEPHRGFRVGGEPGVVLGASAGCDWP